jgi:hypothetical protein
MVSVRRVRVEVVTSVEDREWVVTRCRESSGLIEDLGQEVKRSRGREVKKLVLSPLGEMLGEVVPCCRVPSDLGED